MHGDVKRIQFYLMGLAVVIITVLQLLLIALNRGAIIENEWKRLENYAWNVKIKSIDYNVKGGKTIISIDKNKADMMQSEADGVSLGIVQRKEKYNETLFDGFDAKDKQKVLDGKFVRKTSLADNRHIFKLYQPLYSLKGDVIGIISAMDQSGYYDELLGEIILNIFKVDFTAIFIFGIVFAVYVQKKRHESENFNICTKLQFWGCHGIFCIFKMFDASDILIIYDDKASKKTFSLIFF